MAGTLFIAWLSAAACVVVVMGQERCIAQFETQPNCTTEVVPGGWVYWENMQYKYFPRLMSKGDADNFCKPWDEEVCLGEVGDWNRYDCNLASYVAPGEDANALLAAYNDALFRNGNLFWLGVNRRNNHGKLVYSDGFRSDLNTFEGGVIPAEIPNGQCVAMDGETGQMEVRACTEKLACLCKIVPNKH